MVANKSNGIKFLFGITVLLCFQLLGETIVRLLSIPVPGPVAGLVLLLIALMIIGKSGSPAKIKIQENIQQSSSTLLNHLSLLFVPAGVGVMVHFDKLKEEWMPITIALVAGAVITLAATAISMKLMMRWMRAKDPE